MPSFAHPVPTFSLRGRIPILASIAAGTLIFAAGAAAAACPVPRVTQLTERNGPNCNAATCGFIIVHWAGTADCDHYNIRERSGNQFEAPGTNRSQLHNQRSALFPGRFATNNTIHVAVQGCTRNFFGKSSCSGWSPEVSLQIGGAPQTPPTRGQWGALAADSKGRWGYAVGFQSEAQARDAALKGCGSNECKIAIAGQASCIAYYESRTGGYWYGLALHSVRSRALSVARDGCTRGAPAGTCKLVKVQCAS